MVATYEVGSDPEQLALSADGSRLYASNEDAGASNYDPKLKLIRSMINGSRGPMLRKATALDWAGNHLPLQVDGAKPMQRLGKKHVGNRPY